MLQRQCSLFHVRSLVSLLSQSFFRLPLDLGIEPICTGDHAG
jgi:hypothetical protein